MCIDHHGRYKASEVFGDRDLIFKVIVLYVGYCLNRWIDFHQICVDISFGNRKS